MSKYGVVCHEIICFGEKTKKNGQAVVMFIYCSRKTKSIGTKIVPIENEKDWLNMNKFIVIEGLDGSGKTTVSKLLAERFADYNLDCYRTYEPTRGPIGGLIRPFLAGEEKPFSHAGMALLFSADRIEHIHDEIIPNLANNYVICDRYYYSNMAYQSYDDEGLESVIQYNKDAMKLCKPDIVFFLNVTPEECMKRIEKRGEEKSIYETLNELEIRYRQYLAAIERMKTIDDIIIVGSNTMSAEEIIDQMWTYIKERWLSDN